MGSSWVNSTIGGNWGNIMKKLKPELTSNENYWSWTYGLWMMNLKLNHNFAPK